MTTSRIHNLYTYIGDKRKTRENLCPLQNEMGDLFTQDMENVNKGM